MTKLWLVSRTCLQCLLLVALIWVLGSGCGGGERASDATAARASPVTGAKVFADARCGDCHALAAAGAKGGAGPNLDSLRPSQDRVAVQVREGGNGMPAFESRLSAEQIAAVAAFVSASTRSKTDGEIIKFKPNDVKLESCSGAADYACYEQAFGNLAFRQGPRAALERFERALVTDRNVEADCHPIVHTIGAAALLRYDGSVGRAFSEGNAACGSGYYHGLLQWKLADTEPSKVGGVARRVCDEPVIRSNDFNYYQCVHGLGHGLMLYTRYDLPGALDLCHKLETQYDQVSCTGGVFMENQASSFGIESKWLRKSDPLYPCNVVKKRDKLYCYLMVTSQILPRVSWNWDKTTRWCRRSDAGFVATCFQSYGRDASGTSRQNPDGILSICARAKTMERECIFGAVRDVLNNNASDLRAKALCERVKQGIQWYCYHGIGTILGTLHRGNADRRAACRRFVTGPHLSECVRGAGGS